MDPAPETVGPDTPVEEVVRILRSNELSGVPVVNEGGRCVGIITEEDLVMAGDEGDLHLPHFIELFGGHRLPRVDGEASRSACSARPPPRRRT